jgi:hypothetical protein
VVEGSTRLEPTAMLRAMTDVAADELRGVRLARAVAESADARLTDPRDAEVYRRFVEAVLRWRAFTYPVLPGTETAGRRRPVTTVASGLEQLLPTAKAGTGSTTSKLATPRRRRSSRSGQCCWAATSGTS